MSIDDDELQEQADEAGYGAADEELGEESPPQEQQQPHLQEAQREREADAEPGEDAANGDAEETAG
jgi:hypothetical protein